MRLILIFRAFYVKQNAMETINMLWKKWLKFFKTHTKAVLSAVKRSKW
jgi:hypothetical protein